MSLTARSILPGPVYIGTGRRDMSAHRAASTDATPKWRRDDARLARLLRQTRVDLMPFIQLTDAWRLALLDYGGLNADLYRRRSEGRRTKMITTSDKRAMTASRTLPMAFV